MLYFLPNAKAVTPALLAHHGLTNLVNKPKGRETMRGPNGSGGLIVASDDVPNEQMTYSDTKQKWCKRFGSDAMVGYMLDWPPTPTSLSRDKMVRGQAIVLSDDNAWLVPQLRSFDANQPEGPLLYSVMVDRVLEQDPETGRMVPGDVTREYQQVWSQAVRIGECLLSQITGGDRSTADLPDGMLEDFAAAVLAINYRVGKPELSLLKLLTVELSIRVMQIAIDWDTLQANLKNRLSRLASVGTNTESGATPPTVDSPIPTDPPLPN